MWNSCAFRNSLGIVSTYAGTTSGYADGPALSAKFRLPTSLAVDDFGNVFVGDNGNSCIRRINPQGWLFFSS